MDCVACAVGADKLNHVVCTVVYSHITLVLSVQAASPHLVHFSCVTFCSSLENFNNDPSCVINNESTITSNSV